MIKNPKNVKIGSINQRIGKLIENHIITKHDLLPNQRQRTKGYYDAYNNQHIFEIKGIRSYNKGRAILIRENHKQLVNHEGIYIFVIYNVSSNDKDLSVITDIDIEHEISFHASDMTDLISTTWARKNNPNKVYEAVLLFRILEYANDHDVYRW